MSVQGVACHVCRKWGKQAGAGYEWQEGDIQWTQRNSVVYPAVSSLAGLVAGMFGVGGGIVKVGCGAVSYLLPVSPSQGCTFMTSLWVSPGWRKSVPDGSQGFFWSQLRLHEVTTEF